MLTPTPSYMYKPPSPPPREGVCLYPWRGSPLGLEKGPDPEDLQSGICRKDGEPETGSRSSGEGARRFGGSVFGGLKNCKTFVWEPTHTPPSREKKRRCIAPQKPVGGGGWEKAGGKAGS